MGNQRKQDPVVRILDVLCLGARVGCGIFPCIWDNFYGHGPEKSVAAHGSGSHDVSSISALLSGDSY